MSDYSWPPDHPEPGAGAEAAWAATCQALPIGTLVTGEVVGRQRFGVFLTIDNYPDAVGLAKITAMPRCMELPPLGTRVTGRVLWHADHNHQVGIKLTEWDEHADLLPTIAAMIGQTVTGQITKLAPIGAFVRIADCVEGLVHPEELPDTPAVEGQELLVTILGVDLEQRRISLAAARER